LNREQKVAEYGRHGRDREEEDHDDAVKGEGGVVGLCLHDGFTDGGKLYAHENAEHRGDREPEENDKQVEETDTLVVRRGQPGSYGAETIG